ncbi:hypothetical protein ABEF95_006367 [Exophiala dermatitidis]
MKSRPPVYPKASFHIIRGIAFVCASIVSGILIYFCIQLRHDGFKLPWTFIIVLASTLSSLLALLLSSIIYTFFFLSPLFNLFMNSLILILWTIGLGLLTWNMYGTLGHSCSRANWASDAGMSICRIYKALYSFAIFGWLAQVALVILDIRSRRAQTALGKYDKMTGQYENQKLLDNSDLKLDSLHRSTESTSTLQSQSGANHPFTAPDANNGRRAVGEENDAAAPPYGVMEFENGGRSRYNGGYTRTRGGTMGAASGPSPYNNSPTRSNGGRAGGGGGGGGGGGRAAFPTTTTQLDDPYNNRFAPRTGHADPGYGYGYGHGQDYDGYRDGYRR